ncbi:MAG: YicC family protein [Crocinitomicaceae bacterium]|nr:YicC family protein [Crocinitomicaceae bacterium]MDG1777147.1 YicC family protein [Crocinitomicaceae bacterium]
MLKSMTGFGKASENFQSKKITVEIRSLNSKSMDLNTRIPSQYKEIDGEIRKKISKGLGRGKVDLSINIEAIGDSKAISINTELAKKYYTELKSLNDAFGESTQDYMSLILKMPEVYSHSKEDLTDQEKTAVVQVVQEAIVNINDFRRKEGEDLEREFTERIEEIRALLLEVPKYENERIEIIRERMQKGLEDIKSGTYDDNRLEQEMIFYIEKLDVAEEKMRLSNHLDYFLDTMNTDQAGKKLGFIGQEIGREINTLGSKSNHAEMQKLVIGMKDNLEKIKEQVLNTL